MNLSERDEEFNGPIEYPHKSDELDDPTKIEKAYGACRKCYGKGYSTEQQGSIGNRRYTLRGPKIVYNPCSCDRGKQFQEACKDAVRVALDDVENFAVKEFGLELSGKFRTFIRKYRDGT